MDRLEAGGGDSITSEAQDKPMVGDDAVGGLVTEDTENSDKVMKATVVWCVCVWSVCVCGVCVWCVCVVCGV